MCLKFRGELLNWSFLWYICSHYEDTNIASGSPAVVRLANRSRRPNPTGYTAETAAAESRTEDADVKDARKAFRR